MRDRSPHRATWLRAAPVALAMLGLACGPQADAKRNLGTPRNARAAQAVQAAAADAPLMADHIVVYKSQRRMLLMRGDTVLRTYHVALGLYPQGPKQRAGDSRTPEGHYYLTRRNPRSSYFLSIQVSYPSTRDAARAHAHGWDPGGEIMIHGRPNDLRRDPRYYETHDWTDGCIAVSDSDMLEIWLMTPQDIPIDILP